MLFVPSLSDSTWRSQEPTGFPNRIEEKSLTYSRTPPACGFVNQPPRPRTCGQNPASAYPVLPGGQSSFTFSCTGRRQCAGGRQIRFSDLASNWLFRAKGLSLATRVPFSHEPVPLSCAIGFGNLSCFVAVDN